MAKMTVQLSQQVGTQIQSEVLFFWVKIKIKKRMKSIGTEEETVTDCLLCGIHIFTVYD